MSLIAIIVGVALVAVALADVVNTLVTTTRSRGRWWPTFQLYIRTWSVLRWIGGRLSPGARVTMYGVFAPLSVIALLATWVFVQIIGFGLIWWGLADGERLSGVDGLMDALYYSGVVYFTVGFGEIVPVELVPRIGALVEAFWGVLTIALAIGYLPSLYGAYSEREQQLLMLDDGTEGRITPTNLVLTRAPTGDPRELDAFFAQWEAWVAQVMETHTSFRMLVLFRSQHPGQHWITALGLVTDAALHMELTQGGSGRAPYWLLRRSIRLFQMLTDGADLSKYRAALDETYGDAESPDGAFMELYERMEAHGFEMLPADVAAERSRDLRRRYDAQMEYLIDLLDAPRGFWGHEIGHRVDLPNLVLVEAEQAP